MPKKDTNTTNLHRETHLKVETNIQGTIHDNPLEVNKIFYKMNAQSSYTPEEDMKKVGLGNSLAGNEQSRERLRTKKKQTKPSKPVHKAGQPYPQTEDISKVSPIDEALIKANNKDLSNKGII